MSRPVVSDFTEELYAAMEPIMWADATNGYAALKFLEVVGVMFQDVEDIIRDTDDGPGWSSVMDLDRCPDYALEWLGQFAGVRFPFTLTPDQKRLRIDETDGQKRGSPGALAGAARQFLTGTKYVIINEREGNDPYKLGILTLDSETPDQNQVRNAVLEQKPGGIVLDYNVVPGQNYLALRTAYDTYADVRTAYATYDDLRSNLP